MSATGLIAKCGLDEDDIAQVKALEEACYRADGVRVKFNWSMTEQRLENRASGRPGDFCYYHDGRLVGYMPLDDFGKAYEITAAVLPACRRQGIFRRLFAAARQEAQRNNAAELLLVNYRASESGNAVVGRLDVAYSFSEYSMAADADAIPPLPPTSLQLVEATPEHIADLSRLLGLSFDNSRLNLPEVLRQELQRPGRRYFLAQVDQTLIGQAGVLLEDGTVYIRAVGIVPEWRKRGYGRQMLGAVVARMLAEGHRHLELDVATENSRALSIYQSCGFHETNVYDYYTVPLNTGQPNA